MIREDRYIVIKKSDLDEAVELNFLKKKHVLKLTCILDKYRAYRNFREQPLQCVVVEGDWPEYEAVWRMIEARVDGCEIHEALVRTLPFDVWRDIGHLMNDAAGHYAGSRETPDFFVNVAHWMTFGKSGYATPEGEPQLPSPESMIAGFRDQVEAVRAQWLQRQQDDAGDFEDTDIVTPYDHLLYKDVPAALLEDRVVGKPEPTFAQKLHGLIGYVENGTDTSIHIYHDDATRTVHIDNNKWHEYGDTLEQVVEAAYQQHAEKFE